MVDFSLLHCLMPFLGTKTHLEKMFSTCQMVILTRKYFIVYISKADFDSLYVV